MSDDDEEAFLSLPDDMQIRNLITELALSQMTIGLGISQIVSALSEGQLSEDRKIELGNIAEDLFLNSRSIAYRAMKMKVPPRG